MSVSCQKNLSITIGNSKFYWTLGESTPAADRVDMFNAVHLIVATLPGFNNPVVDASGLYGNAVRFNDPAPATSELDAGINTPLPVLGYAVGQGLSFWAWVKPNNATAPSGPTISFFWHVFSDPMGTNQLGQFDMLINGIQQFVQVQDFSNNQLFSNPSALSLTPGNWQMLGLKYNPATSKFSIRINLGTWTDSNPIFNIGTAPYGTFSLLTSGGGPNYDMTVDEMGLVYEVLTDAQWTQIYNGGIGVTWPAISTIV